MELLSNLLWLALSSLFLGLWLLRRNRWTDESLRSNMGVQFIALALVIVVLLPVVSLTDDLQACTVPAESEHLARRSDFQALTDYSLHAVSVAIAGLVSFYIPPQPRTLAWLSLPIKKEAIAVEYLRILGTRPPPAA